MITGHALLSSAQVGKAYYTSLIGSANSAFTCSTILKEFVRQLHLSSLLLYTMSDSSSYIPASQDLEVLEVASVLMGNEYNRAPKSQQEAVEQAHAVLAEHFKITQTSAWDDLQVHRDIR